ncbi:hypothetical protein O0I10_006772 [Lichtheimia ornata]|uniref:Uncharacterized protein n=1 Tax=Lichtheimia ornata TaxID=688661 RepID=A0AAD7XWW0_9FUNG|nr:uncharacterized protein O0I10_006772 [Lichtheimia ornata]KAJ8657470.1 hypothetical protein O0I10_006772 [Lichtheimia ornata]
MMTDFNPAPVLLRDAASTVVADDPMMFDKHPCYISDEDCSDTMEVPQNLNPEQVRYEFPPKSRLQELAQYYDNDDCSFFDESSFTTTSTSTAAYNTSITEQQDYYDDDEEETLMRLNAARRSADYASDHLDRFFHSVSSAWQQDDVMMTMMDDDDDEQHRASSMSPLHLPQQQQHRPREESCDSTDTVKQCRAARDHLSKGIAPSALLGCVQEEGYRSTRANSDDLELPVFRSESALRHSSSRTASLLHSDNESTASSAVVVMRIRRKPKSPLLAARMVPSQDDDRMTWSDSSDEGYVDEEKPMDSASLFLPLSDHEQHQLQDNEMLRVTAAIKIQAVWRGYHFRQQMKKHTTTTSRGLKPTQRLMMDIVKLCGGVHKRQMTRMRQRLDTLEMHLEEETAMRIAFEKAMEDMTVMIDEQHKALYDRIEQEASMRQYYERKMDDTLGRIKPLERQLRQEARDRTELESMMTCVLEQMQDMKREAKAESDARRRLQAELDAARDEIARLKRPNSTTAPMADRPRSSMMISTQQQQQQRQGLLRAGDTRSVSAMANKKSMTTTTLRRPTTASTLSTKKTTTTTTTLGTPQRGSSRMEMKKSIIPSTPSLLSRKR